MGGAARSSAKTGRAKPPGWPRRPSKTGTATEAPATRASRTRAIVAGTTSGWSTGWSSTASAPCSSAASRPRHTEDNMPQRQASLTTTRTSSGGRASRATRSASAPSTAITGRPASRKSRQQRSRKVVPSIASSVLGPPMRWPSPAASRIATIRTETIRPCAPRAGSLSAPPGAVAGRRTAARLFWGPAVRIRRRVDGFQTAPYHPGGGRERSVQCRPGSSSWEPPAATSTTSTPCSERTRGAACSLSPPPRSRTSTGGAIRESWPVRSTRRGSRSIPSRSCRGSCASSGCSRWSSPTATSRTRR